MERIPLEVQLREGKGKQANKKLRSSGMFPAVVYKGGEETLSLEVDKSKFLHVLHTSAGGNVIINLKIKDKETAKKDRTVVIKVIQYHPIKEEILHVDFKQISLTEKITVTVPVELRGEAFGVKAEGGVLDHITKDIEIECLPTQIPEKIEHNVEEMKIGDTIRVKDLKVPPEVKVLADPEQPIASLTPPAAVEEVAVEEAVEGEEAQEPEVITEKKPEEEEAPPEGEAPPEKGKKKPKEKKE